MRYMTSESLYPYPIDRRGPRILWRKRREYGDINIMGIPRAYWEWLWPTRPAVGTAYLCWYGITDHGACLDILAEPQPFHCPTPITLTPPTHRHYVTVPVPDVVLAAWRGNVHQHLRWDPGIWHGYTCALVRLDIDPCGPPRLPPRTPPKSGMIVHPPLHKAYLGRKDSRYFRLLAARRAAEAEAASIYDEC